MNFDFSPLALLNVAYFILIILLSLSIHESAHAWAANKLGDPTARMLGRVTLNPLPHIDPFGTLLLPAMLALFGLPVFGWAKPVPIISRNFKHLRRDEALVAAAGPLSNLILATLASVVIVAMGLATGAQAVFTQMQEAYTPAWAILQFGVLNLALAAFNFIPLPPLDGSHVLSALLPSGVEAFYEKIRALGPLILIVLFMTGAFSLILGPLLFGLEYVFYILPLQLLG
ncbi:MAG: site-2 protease family protein [Acidobacteria bacterium]|jgi:Zn-dependent protease|nr:site-2 protease family protein [Acidobacteriota bacterium]